MRASWSTGDRPIFRIGIMGIYSLYAQRLVICAKSSIAMAIAIPALTICEDFLKIAKRILNSTASQNDARMSIHSDIL